MAAAPTREIVAPDGYPAEVREYLARDPVRNAYVAELLEHHRSDARFWAVRERGRLVAHLAVHRIPDIDVEWAYLSGAAEGARLLLERLPPARAVTLADAALAPLVGDRLRGARRFPEAILEVDRAHAHLADPAPAVRLGPEMAEAYAALVVPPSLALTPTMLERNRRHLAEGVVFGILDAGRLVSVAGAVVRGPNAWVVSGVETLPEHRRRGYALRVTSAVTRAGLEASERVGLWVRDDNPGARTLYERLGYRETGASVWFDEGTGLEP